MNDKIMLGITYFKSLTTNFIQSHPSTFVTTNFGKFYSQGIETEVDLELPYNLALSIRHTWNDHYLDEKSKSDTIYKKIRDAAKSTKTNPTIPMIS